VTYQGIPCNEGQQVKPNLVVTDGVDFKLDHFRARLYDEEVARYNSNLFQQQRAEEWGKKREQEMKDRSDAMNNYLRNASGPSIPETLRPTIIMPRQAAKSK
jgi:hypothetical protein